MSPLGLLAIGAGLSQVLLSGALLVAGGLSSLSRRLYGVLMVGVLAYLLLPLTGWWSGQWFLGGLTILVPGVFWLFCASLFDDHYEFPLWQPALVALDALIPTVFGFFDTPGQSTGDWLFRDIPQALEFVFLGLALFAIFRNWRDDLVAERRRLRLWFCGSSGLFIFLLILSREVLFAGEPWLGTAQYLATAGILLGTNILLLRFPTYVFEPIRRAGPKPEAPAAPAKTATADLEDQLEPITRLIVEEGIHREYGMTIGKLSAAAGMPEYRLRQLINSGLGYRNFNDFLNSFRID